MKIRPDEKTVKSFNFKGTFKDTWIYEFQSIPNITKVKILFVRISYSWSPTHEIYKIKGSTNKNDFKVGIKVITFWQKIKCDNNKPKYNV